MNRPLPALPCRAWARAYDRDTLAADTVAAAIVTILLIPQSLAYALLAGLPPQAGLYASVAPLLVYAVFGSSRVLAVGPVAVVSLMTAAAIGSLPPDLRADPQGAALVLAALSGAMLLAMGLLKLGLVANFLSHPVISGFITASGLLIAAGQLKGLLGIPLDGHTLPQLLASLAGQLGRVHGPTLAVGAATLAFLFGVRHGLAGLLQRLGLSAGSATLLARAAPVGAIGLATWASWHFGWAAGGMKVVGTVPQGLPPLGLPPGDPALWRALALPALLISVVGFVESVSVGQTLAARRRQRIEPDQELVALGGANLAAAFSGGLPVTGGFARSVVNADAGARTPAAGVFTAAGLLAASLWLTPALYHLPQAVLAATIVVAVLSLVDFGVLARTWRYSKADFAAVAATLLGTLLLGVEPGLVAGVGLSLALHLLRSSRPHIAEVGRVPGTEHFRNVQRHAVQTSERLLGLRVDESLYFANARSLEDRINDAVATRPALQHVVLQCSAVNAIDASALDSLEAIDQRLREAGLALHLSEVKGPVMDKLAGTPFLRALGGRVFLTHFQAVAALAPETLQARAGTPPAPTDAARAAAEPGVTR
ncbi:sulfate permease [Piscinibacter sakaiensis]|uniref:Sulfate permease n=1 Tax=Piscinibacter sakaiensis TaxID=1547922 RepID=A0A0K8NXR9_PISS1|nr:sulfate permease [Piscinibacter sakaiensis]GAP34725.1 sulfate permease [Piscinibacter sakaiensis]